MTAVARRERAVDCTACGGTGFQAVRGPCAVSRCYICRGRGVVVVSFPPTSPVRQSASEDRSPKGGEKQIKAWNGMLALSLLCLACSPAPSTAPASPDAGIIAPLVRGREPAPPAPDALPTSPDALPALAPDALPASAPDALPVLAPVPDALPAPAPDALPASVPDALPASPDSLPPSCTTGGKYRGNACPGTYRCGEVGSVGQIYWGTSVPPPCLMVFSPDTVWLYVPAGKCSLCYLGGAL